MSGLGDPNHDDRFWAEWRFPDGTSVTVNAMDGYRPVITWFDEQRRIHRDDMPAVITVSAIRYYENGVFIKDATALQQLGAFRQLGHRLNEILSPVEAN